MIKDPIFTYIKVIQKLLVRKLAHCIEVNGRLSNMNTVELDEVQWRSPEWIQAYGLNKNNVLDYFALSPFYDRSSNNQVLKMQSNFNEQMRMNGIELTKELKKLTGIEYQVVISREPDLWVIFKQNRKSPTDTDVLAVYFVTGENIFQSPSIYNVLASRILATSKFLEEALQIAEQLPEFSSGGYEYRQNEVAQETSVVINEEAKEDQVQSVTSDKDRNVLLDRALTMSIELLRSQQLKK